MMISFIKGKKLSKLEPCISAWADGPRLCYAARAGLQGNFHVIVQTQAGPRACFILLLIFYILDIHQLVMKKNAALVETTRDCATATVKSGSTVFIVPPAAACMVRAISAAEEFCVQTHAIG